MPSGRKPIVLLWENFGPNHYDRLNAVADAGYDLTAIQIASKSNMYDWEEGGSNRFRTVTLAKSHDELTPPILARKIVAAVGESGARDIFMCHYEFPGVFMAAGWLRATGRRPYAMIASKFDDYDRKWWRESGKSVLLKPYCGAIVGSERSVRYMRFLGLKDAVTGYDTLSVERLRSQNPDAIAELDGTARPFLVVARLVPKKNIAFTLECFAQYVARNGTARRLEILGDGPLRSELEAKAQALGIAGQVDFRGLCPTAEVTGAMQRSAALLLPSIEEQYGLVVIEALASGLPVIASTQCGATDVVLDNLVNGFAVASDSHAQMLAAMEAIGTDESMRKRMAAAAYDSAERGDVRHFVAGLERLMG
ncbi:glycosyltransferase family 4 protein [Croceicoccus sediminis]|uniref:glycosyltransferase family 4 protein n=1 Tax=Croceicoccus sediminis TaxID=2571150 RepID=UPI0011840058|nr:glycosyltransferase family 4 protein [Croceicoccus sediminis]